MTIGVLSGTAKDGTKIEIVFESYMKTPVVQSGGLATTLNVLGLSRAARTVSLVSGFNESNSNKTPDLKVLTFNNYKRSGAGRWGTHDIIMSKPLLEFIGPGLDDLSFSVLLHSGLGIAPATELKKLRRLRDEGIICLLMVGGEQVTDNKVVLQKVDEDNRTLDGTGQILVAEVSLSFLEYVETIDKSNKNKAKTEEA